MVEKLKNHLIENNYILSEELGEELKKHILEYLEREMPEIYNDETDISDFTIIREMPVESIEKNIKAWNEIEELVYVLYLCCKLIPSKTYNRVIQLAINRKEDISVEVFDPMRRDDKIEIWARKDRPELHNTLRNIIENIDRSDKNRTSPGIEIISDLGLNEGWIYEFKEISDLVYNDDHPRVKTYWIENWCCTDTWVGKTVIFLDDEPVCVSSQDARKSDITYEWVSKEGYGKLKNYILSLVKDSENIENISIVNLDQDMGNGYKIGYENSVLDWNGITWNGKAVKKLKKVEPEQGRYYIGNKYIFKTESEEEIEIHMEDLRFPYKTKKEDE